VSENDSAAAKKQMQWPALKWSPDDKYVARVTPGQMISVHELPSMYLHGKKSLKIEGVVDFEWCPQGDRDREDAEKDALVASTGAGAKTVKKARENMLVYWTPEVVNQPARVTLLGFPSRAILRQKNLFNVTEVRTADIFLTTSMFNQQCSVNCIGRTKGTFFASRWIAIPRPKNRSSATWRFSA
jgi:translation initiation factor 3 subunit B